jgi:putative (di)nucleoside polyphosphate hydrolase
MRSVRVVGEVPGWLHYEFPTAVRSTFTGEWARFRGQAQRWFLLAFEGDDSEIDVEGPSHREFAAWRWMELADLPPRVIAFKRGVYEAVAAELGPRISALRAAGELRPRQRGGRSGGGGGGSDGPTL